MNKKLIRKMQTAAGGGLVYDDGKNIERTNYNNWTKLSFVDKMKRRFNICNHVNMMRSDLSDEELLKYCKAIVNYVNRT